MDTAGRRSRILVVEDDRSMREALVIALRAAGYEPAACGDGGEMEGLLQRFRPDLAILDVRLPGKDGFALAERLDEAAAVPVVFVTAADAVEERLRGFNLGADDYVVKPFSMPELLARVRAVLRRSGRLRSPAFEVGDLVIDELDHAVARSGANIELTPTEFQLLLVLSRNPGREFSKMRLLSIVWGFEDFRPNLVEVHVSSLRKKLEAHGPRLVHTTRGGYEFRF